MEEFRPGISEAMYSKKTDNIQLLTSLARPLLCLPGPPMKMRHIFKLKFLRHTLRCLAQNSNLSSCNICLNTSNFLGLNTEYSLRKIDFTEAT